MKKFKLFTTIASLCLAVALMAFGVYAAQNSLKHTVSGNISYESTSIKGTWNITVTAGTGAELVDGVTGSYTNVTAEAEGKTEDVDLKIQKNADTATFTVKAVFANGSTTAGTLSSTFTNVTEDAYKIEYEEVAGADKTIEASSGTAEITVKVTVTILDTTANISEMPWSVAFTAAASELGNN